MELRGYQKDAKQKIYDLWTVFSRILLVMPTGAGKTVLFSSILADHRGVSCVVAHRREILVQISMALAKCGVRHQIIGPKSLIKQIATLQTEELGTCFYDSNASCIVASVDTIRASRKYANQLQKVTLYVIDEGHHVLRGNKWGDVIPINGHVRVLGVTATPRRADGKGLGAGNDGIYQILLLGPSTKELIETGHLSRYRVFSPPSDLVLDAVPVTPAGDYSSPRLKEAIQQSHIVGDIVDHYLRIAPGKLGVTFATDVETATEIADKFNASGVPAKMVCAKTPLAERIAALRDFRERRILQLVNVDLFGEGFDLPSMQVVSLARPTQSLALYLQQVGRCLRPDGSDEFAIIIDHVGNFMRHKPPDAHREWSLDRRERRSKKEGVPRHRTCPMCSYTYEKMLRGGCPECHAIPTPASRSSPEFVDGDLIELDEEAREKLWGEVAKMDRSVGEFRKDIQARRVPYEHAQVQHFEAAQRAQAVLRSSMDLWAGWKMCEEGWSFREAQKLFYLTFEVDVLSAQALKKSDAEKLNNRVYTDIPKKTA